MIIGLDVSLNGFGYAIMENNKIIDYSVIKPGKIKTQFDKIKNIQILMTEIINKYKITEAIFEDTYFSRNPVTTKLLSRIAGVIIAILNNNNIPYRFITTMTMKSEILGCEIKQPKRKKGEPKPKKIDYKELQRLKIIKDYNLPENTVNDITDAIGLCIIGIDKIYDKPKVKKTKKKVVKK